MQLDDAKRVLRVLTAAFPTYPVDEDTVELYLAAMVNNMPDAGVAFAVVTDWTMERLTFPRVAELIEAYTWEQSARQAKARKREKAQEHYVEGTVACLSCHDSGMEEWTDEQGRQWAAPCSGCQPERRAYWREGHMDVGHSVSTCEHPRCVARAKRGRRG